MQETILWITKIVKTPLVCETCRNRHRFGSLIPADLRQSPSSVLVVRQSKLKLVSRHARTSNESGCISTWYNCQTHIYLPVQSLGTLFASLRRKLRASRAFFLDIHLTAFLRMNVSVPGISSCALRSGISESRGSSGSGSQCRMNWTARGSVNPPSPWSFIPPHQERYFYSKWKQSRSKVFLTGPRHACTAPKHLTLLETLI